MLSLIATALLVLSTALPLPALQQAQRALSQQAAASSKLVSSKIPVSASYVARPAANTKGGLNIKAESALAVDTAAGVTLYQKSPDKHLPIASITKVMTALVILHNHALDETVTVPNLPAQELGSQAMGIKAGEQFKLSEALHGMLTYSANDMAQALARWDSGSEEAFVAKMNDQAKLWGMSSTHYVDATGLSSQGSYSSARDLITLGSIALNSNFFRQVVSQPRYSVSTLSDKRYLVTTTNHILGSGGVVGIKTGYTLEAGQCLLSLTQRGGHEIMAVVLNSPDRFGETQNLNNWVFNTYNWN